MGVITSCPRGKNSHIKVTGLFVVPFTVKIRGLVPLRVL